MVGSSGALSERIEELERQREEEAIAKEDNKVEASCQADIQPERCD